MGILCWVFSRKCSGYSVNTPAFLLGFSWNVDWSSGIILSEFFTKSLRFYGLLLYFVLYIYLYIRRKQNKIISIISQNIIWDNVGYWLNDYGNALDIIEDKL